MVVVVVVAVVVVAVVVALVVVVVVILAVDLQGWLWQLGRKPKEAEHSTIIMMAKMFLFLLQTG